MKLISLHIENFGGLHQYSLNFQDDLTVVQQPNGFGKTTLAEFIRAMFYGFPRRAKTLDKSRRQKYTPWQGGKFSGNLVFEYRGNRYRIERTFGATPKGDSFTLIDLSTGKKSDRFSEEIGLEIFQLDADSFERSTYMPQLQGLTSLTTDSIQAKLGNLVEDAGDMGNYENAVTSLKSARSAFIPYRGSGGSVAEAQGEISRLQTQLDQAAALEHTISDSQAEIAALEETLAALNAQQQEIRTRILTASEAAAVAASRREYGQILNRKTALENELNRLKDRYPNALPSEQQLSEARQAASELELLSASGNASQEDLDAEAYLTENRSRFENHIPTREELDRCRDQINHYHTLRTQMQSIGLSEAEKELYSKLLPLAESGVLDSSRLDKLDTASRELVLQEQALNSITIPEDDRSTLDELKLYFAPGVPEEEEIQSKRNLLARASDLRREKTSLLGELAGVHPERPGILLCILALAALAGIGAGIWLPGIQHALAISCFALGGCALLGLSFLIVRLIGKNRERNLHWEDLQQQIADLDRQAAALEQTAADFTGRYTVTLPVSDALIEIRDNRVRLKTLATKIAEITAETRTLSGKVQSLRTLLTHELGQGNFDRRILDLRLAAGQFRDLTEEIAATERKISQLQAESTDLCGEITAFLGSYYPNPQPDAFHALLSDLQRSSEAYAAAKERLAARKQQEANRLAELTRLETVLSAFFHDFGLTRQENLREQLLKIRDDIRDFRELTLQHQHAAAQAENYFAANQAILEKPVGETLENLEELQVEENILNQRIQDASALLLDKKQRLSRNLDQHSQLPALRDELEFWQEKKRTDQQRASVLDDTMVFLEKAREKLQNSYLGPLRSSFTGYIERLLGEDSSRILLTPDLDVRLERSGQTRELGYFSAGQTDGVMLCMRLALVDALFTDTKPFIILDDPFINLDDERTAQALTLLQDLARDRQIIYLVCNSSRTPK